MAKFIQIGNCSKTYRYIGYIIIALFFKDVSFGSHNVEYFDVLKLIPTGKLEDSYFIHQFFCYIAIAIFCYIRYKRENISRHSSIDLEANEIQLDNHVQDNPTLDFELIHNDVSPDKGYPNIYLLLMALGWVFNEELLNHFSNVFIHLDFWMLELMIITYFMKKKLKLKTYRHQYFSFILSSAIPIILKIMTIIFSFYDGNNKIDSELGYKYSKATNKLKVLYVDIYWLVPIGLVIYFILITVRSFINTNIKWLIDIKYISPNKILVFFGLIGAIFCFLVSLISSFKSCGDWNENKKDISDYFCKVQYHNKIYFENIAAYFNFYTEEEDEKKKNYIYLEMLSVIIGVASFIGYWINIMKIIEILTPVHIIFATPIYYLCNKTYLIVFNLILSDNHEPVRQDIDSIPKRISMDYISDFFSVLGFLVYLEIIELNFWGLDYNLKRKILDRGLIDVSKADFNKSYDTNSDSANSTTNKSFTSLNDSDM